MNRINLFLALTFFMIGGYITVAGQKTASSDLSECVNLRMVKEKPSPPVRDYFAPDVISKTDGSSFQFELKNNCSQTVYYLAFNLPSDNTTPAAVFLYQDKDGECGSGTPTWYRKRNLLTSPGLYHWLPIRTGKIIKFEYTSFKWIPGEHSLEVYVKYYPKQEEMVEILAGSFSMKK
jgi:hypothetical protein